MLDLALFRADQGGGPDEICELQKKRFKNMTHGDKVVEPDNRWRKCKYSYGVSHQAYYYILIVALLYYNGRNHDVSTSLHCILVIQEGGPDT